MMEQTKTYLQRKYTVRKGKRKLRNKYLQVKLKENKKKICSLKQTLFINTKKAKSRIRLVVLHNR